MHLRSWARAPSHIVQGMFQMEREMCWFLVQPAPSPPASSASPPHQLVSAFQTVFCISWLRYLGLSNQPPQSPPTSSASPPHQLSSVFRPVLSLPFISHGFGTWACHPTSPPPSPPASSVSVFWTALTLPFASHGFGTWACPTSPPSISTHLICVTPTPAVVSLLASLIPPIRISWLQYLGLPSNQPPPSPPASSASPPTSWHHGPFGQP